MGVLDKHPFDHLFTAVAAMRRHSRDEAAKLLRIAQNDLAVWQQEERGRPDVVAFDASWPDWRAAAALIAARLHRQLNEPTTSPAGTT